MRHLTTSYSVLLVGLLLAGCGSKDSSVNDKALIDTNFDNLVGWVDNSGGSLTKKFAHSGHYSLTVGGGAEYGTTFRCPLGQITATKPRKLQVSAWVRAEEANTPVQLVVQITKPVSDEKVFWKSLPVANNGKPGQWKELKTDIVLPDNVANDQLLGVYMWGANAAKPVYLDDLKIINAE